jgi:hypothetical protein
MTVRWWAWLLLGAIAGGWVGYEIGRPTWLRAAQSIASGQRAPGIVEAVAVAAAGVGDRWDVWRLEAAQQEATQCAADLAVAERTAAEWQGRVRRIEGEALALRRAAQASAAQQVAEVIDGVSERAALYAGECRDWGLQPVCPALLRLRDLERSELSATGSADRGGAGGAGDPAGADHTAGAPNELQGQRERGAGDLFGTAGDPHASGQPGPGVPSTAGSTQ